ncbi:hypothetical protein [Candidatus Pyrohabitans sp.]
MELSSLLDFIVRRGMSVNLLLGEEKVAELRAKGERDLEVVVHNAGALRRMMEELMR